MKLYIIAIVFVLVIWIAWGFVVSNAPALSYTVIGKKKGYEIRQYDSYIAATAIVPFTGREGLNAGFRVLAGYIFGGNTAQKSISMTVPVQVSENTKNSTLDTSQKISMTTPVLVSDAATTTTVTFSMPREYTLETLPKPNDSSIVLEQIPAKKFAAYRFTWNFTPKRIEEKKKYFVELLKKDSAIIVGEPVFAGYSGPGTAPFMMRNEILVEIE